MSFPPPNPGPRIRKGVLADPVLVVIVWWPRIEGYTHHLSVACVGRSVLVACTNAGAPPHAQTPALIAETGQTASERLEHHRRWGRGGVAGGLCGATTPGAEGA